jgi:hypothetical protein
MQKISDFDSLEQNLLDSTVSNANPLDLIGHGGPVHARPPHWTADLCHGMFRNAQNMAAHF